MTIQIELKTAGCTYISTSDTREPLIFHSSGETYFVETGFLPLGDGSLIPFFAMLDHHYLPPAEKIVGLGEERIQCLAQLLDGVERVSYETSSECPQWLVFARTLDLEETLDLTELAIRNLLAVRAGRSNGE